MPREILLGAIGRALALDADGRGERETLGDWNARLATLTPREREVLERVVCGKLNKVIGAELGTAERTVATHRARVMEKMGAASLAELVHIIDRLRAGGVMPADSAQRWTRHRELLPG